MPASRTEPARPCPEQLPGDRAASGTPEGRGGEPDAGQRAERDFARLKEEIMGEMRTGWRSWLFHPAWTVAASVLLVCAALIHVSPRRIAGEDAPPRAVIPEASARTRPLGARPGIERLPPPAEKRRAGTAAAQPAPPALGDSGVLNQSFPEEMKNAAAQPAPEADGAAATPSFRDFMDAAGAGGPPRLIERGQLLDRRELALDLATLAGMHIGAGELAEAWEAVRKLRAYAAGKADELTGVLISLETAEQAAAGTPPTREPDKYFAAGAPPPLPADRTVPPSPAGNSVSPAPAPAPAATAGADAGNDASELPADGEAEAVAAYPEPASTSRAANGGQLRDDAWPESGAPILPDVPKPSQDAAPPTLRESSGQTDRFRLFPSANPERRAVNRFSTDPYFRED